MAVLNGGDALDLADDEFELLDLDDEDTLLYAVSDEFIELLLSIKQNEIADIAKKCAIETAEEISWQANDFIPVITELRALSIKAKEQSQGMYFWNSI